MAHFAQIKNGLVEQVIVVANEVLLDEDGIEQETIGKEFCANIFGGEWVQTSYNANFRGQYAAVGMKYDSVKDEFVLNETVE
jgi:hypothetical protein